eukprot:2774997-Lingulodinium_polyedra.AAC.1
MGRARARWGCGPGSPRDALPIGSLSPCPRSSRRAPVQKREKSAGGKSALRWTQDFTFLP